MADMSLGKQLIVFVLLGGVIFFAFHYLIYSNKTTEIETKQAEKDALEIEVGNARITAAKLDDFRRDVEQKEAELRALSRILPSSKEVADLIRKVNQQAVESRLVVSRFDPGNSRSRDFYAEWPISLELDGSYHNLAYFFDRLSRLSRIVNVSDLKITANSTPTLSSTIKATCTATTFVFEENAAGAQ